MNKDIRFHGGLDLIPGRLRDNLAFGCYQLNLKAEKFSLNVDKERKMHIAEIQSGLVKGHGKHPVSTDGGTWYPLTCRFLKLDHHIHSSYEKSLMERTMQYIKDRTEISDHHFPCKLKNTKLKHINNLVNLSVN